MWKWCLTLNRDKINIYIGTNSLPYRVAIEKYDGFMKSEFPISQPSRKFGKWGTNLARCGTEVALRTIKFSGVCGIVSPASLFNDQVSGALHYSFCTAISVF